MRNRETQMFTSTFSTETNKTMKVIPTTNGSSCCGFLIKMCFGHQVVTIHPALIMGCHCESMIIYRMAKSKYAESTLATLAPQSSQARASGENLNYVTQVPQAMSSSEILNYLLSH